MKKLPSGDSKTHQYEPITLKINIFPIFYINKIDKYNDVQPIQEF